MDTNRLEAFSDGVFAIAITLLVISLLDIHTRLAHHWPEYAAFAFSFLTIGVMWVNHHHLMNQFARADRVFLFLNLLLLMGIVFIPFPTALIGEHLVRDREHIAGDVFAQRHTAGSGRSKELFQDGIDLGHPTRRGLSS